MAAVIGRNQLARLLEGWVAGEGALHARLTGRLRALVRSGTLPMPCATSFAQAAERGGVALLPGPTFSCADALDDFLRISYAPPLPDVLRGLRRAADAWRAFTC